MDADQEQCNKIEQWADRIHSSPERWRSQAKGLAQVLRASLVRSYLTAPPDILYTNMSIVPNLGGGMPTSWLRVDCVGDAASRFHMDPVDALRVAVASCHRPGLSRLYFLVRGDEAGNHVYLGLRSVGYGTDSASLAWSLKSLLESSWPGTKLSPCESDGRVETDLAAFTRKAGGRFAMTGVPMPLRPDGSGGFSMDFLLNGLMGRRFGYLIIADPIAPAEQDSSLASARDLVGALHAVSKFTLTRSSSISSTQGTSTTHGKMESHTLQMGTSRTSKPYSEVQSILEAVAFGGIALMPLVPFAGFVAGLAAVGALVIAEGTPVTESENASHTMGSSFTSSESASESSTFGTAIAREYVSSHLDSVMRQINGLIGRLDGNSTWEVGAYLFSDSSDTSMDATAQLAGLLNGPRKLGEEPVRFIDLHAVWRRGFEEILLSGHRPRLRILMNQGGAALDHPLGAAFDGLSTPLNSDELALLLSLPRREVPGINVRPYADFGLNPQLPSGPSLTLGRVLRGDDETPATMSISHLSLTKNVLVTGSVGSGKTNTVKHLLRQLLNADKPFLVIEPAKSEYVDWAKRLNSTLESGSKRRIRIFNPGSASSGDEESPLRLNPFQVLSTDSLTLHIERLKTMLIASMPMQESLPMLLESVLYALYSHNGWFDEKRIKDASTRIPTISQALHAKRTAVGSADEGAIRDRFTHGDTYIGEVILSKGYDDRVAQSFIGALRTRLEFLCQPGSWKSKVFDCQQSTSPEELFGGPTVVNISNLHSDRPFAAGILLSYLHEWHCLQQRRGISKAAELKHVCVLEEAHCLLERTGEVTAETMNPKGMLSAMCAEMLSEMRGWGQGFIVVDQYPTRLISDAVKNTNIKIIHKLPAREDQEIVSAAMSLNAGQAKLIPYLRPGQAMVSGELDDFPFRIRVPLGRGE